LKRKTNYKKNTKRRLISTILLFVIIAGIVFSIPVKTVYAAADGSSSGIVTPEVALAIDQSASTFGIGQAFKGLWTMALAVPFLPVFGFISSILMPAANSLFVWAVKVDNFKAVVGSTAVYNIWKIVRDFLNIAFILVLLFSAFATIFQVEKYSYKKILLNLVLMALLVNFSFPIARFIIDVSNVLMYTLISMLFVDGQNGATKAMGMMADKAMLSGILSPSGGTASTIAALLAAIIFGFIFAITMLAVAIMLVIRIIALAILIMFSPIAFVASILPSTSNYANDWWNQLFKYAFFGPIMIFMLYIALTVMTEFSKLETSNFNIIAGSQSEDANFIGKIAYLAIPIVILWIGMGTAQKMSIAGAGAVMGGTQKILKSFGSRISGIDAVKRGYKAYEKRRDAHHAGDIFERAGTGIGSAGDRLRQRYGPTERSRREAQNRLDQDQKNREKAAYESHDMGNMEEEQLRQLMAHGTADEMAAATRALAEKSTATEADLDAVREAFGETSQVFRQLVNKVKTYDPAAAFAHITDNTARETAKRNFITSNQFDHKKLNAHSIGDEQTMRLALETRSIDSKGIEELRKKDSAAVQSVMRAVATRRDPATGNYAYTNMGDEVHREIQMAHLGQTGQFSAAVAGTQATRQRLYKDADENILKRMDATHLAPAYINDFEQSVSSSKLSKILPSIQDDKVVGPQLAKHLRKKGGKHAQYMKQNPNLRGLYT